MEDVCKLLTNVRDMVIYCESLAFRRDFGLMCASVRETRTLITDALLATDEDDYLTPYELTGYSARLDACVATLSR